MKRQSFEDEKDPLENTLNNLFYNYSSCVKEGGDGETQTGRGEM